jgi:hypothetical protein
MVKDFTLFCHRTLDFDRSLSKMEKQKTLTAGQFGFVSMRRGEKKTKCEINHNVVLHRFQLIAGNLYKGYFWVSNAKIPGSFCKVSRCRYFGRSSSKSSSNIHTSTSWRPTTALLFSQTRALYCSECKRLIRSRFIPSGHELNPINLAEWS